MKSTSKDANYSDKITKDIKTKGLRKAQLEHLMNPKTKSLSSPLFSTYFENENFLGQWNFFLFF